MLVLLTIVCAVVHFEQLHAISWLKTLRYFFSFGICSYFAVFFYKVCVYFVLVFHFIFVIEMCNYVLFLCIFTNCPFQWGHQVVAAEDHSGSLLGQHYAETCERLAFFLLIYMVYLKCTYIQYFMWIVT